MTRSAGAFATATHDALIDRLKPRFGDRGWALLKTVANRLGGPTNYADAVSLSLYRSRGIELHGFEAKVSRADFLGELKKPHKAEAVARYCDRWWIVLGDRAIAEPDEVPPAWGILAARGTGLTEVRAAQKLNPEPLDRAFVAALLIRVHEHQASTDAVQDAYRRGHKDGLKSAEKSANYGKEAWKFEREQHQKAVEAFEKASGITWGHGWNAGNIGAAVRVVLDGNVGKKVQWLHGLVRREEKQLREALKELGVEPESNP